MNLILKIVNNPKETLTVLSHEFKQEGGSIGRESTCSWILHDSKGVVSRVHANIEYKAGEYYLIDVSSNGMLYKQSNHLVPKGELVKLKESEVLCIGEYEIIVGFVKGKAKKDYIGELLNQREMDIAVKENLMHNKEGNAALNVILEGKAKDKDILDYAKTGINRAEEVNFADAFGEEEPQDDNSVYSTHITAPTFQEENEEEVKSSSSDDWLISILSSKLGINIQALKKERQIELITELADGLLLSLEATERLKQNIKEIEIKLEKPTMKLSSTKSLSGKSLLSTMVFKENNRSMNLKETLSQRFQEIQQQHTALYEASREQSEALEHEFAPENLNKAFQAKKTMFSFIGADAENWRSYVTRYHALNPSSTSGSKEGFNARLYKRYQSVLETLKLSQGTN